ncbi:MAG TPA: MetQ/NlpA family ABC transporter substrate-binding protein [Anaerolineaceae bacterium]
MKRIFLSLIFIIFMLSLLTGCGGSAKQESLKVAVLPVLDVFPLYVAQKQGYFEKNGIRVELVPVASAPERDQLIQAGQVDGMLNELVATLFYNQGETRIQNIRFARIATNKYPVFRILASPGSGIKSPADLKGKEVAISDGTVIEYTTDRLLEKAGVKPSEIKKVSIPKIPDRLSLLASSKVNAANMPDPTASLALRNGSTLVIDDTTYPEISHSVYSFSVESLKQKPQAVRAFLKAVEQAVGDVNKDKARWLEYLKELKIVPAEALENYILPDYPAASVPSEAQFQDALAWVKTKGLKGDPTYKDTVNASFLPK